MIAVLFTLTSLVPVIVVLSGPFCAIQLALCKYCKGDLLPKLPILLSCLGLLGSLYYMADSNNIEALVGLLILFPSVLCLIGSGLGRLIWNYAQEHLY